MLFGCVFEKQERNYPLPFLPESPSYKWVMVRVGAPSTEDGGGFDGVALTFKFTPSDDGATDTGAIIGLHRSFDGTTPDDARFDEITVAASNIGEYPNTWRLTAIYPVVPRESGQPSCGYATAVRISKSGGDRTMNVNLYVRRWRWKVGL